MKHSIKNQSKWKPVYAFLALLIMSYPGSGAEPEAGPKPAQRERLKLITGVFREYQGNHLIYISKNDFMLFVYNRKHRVLFKAKIAYGFNPDSGAKLHEGDQRTPEGVYRIKTIYSLASPVNSESYQSLKELNELHLKASEGFFRYDDPEKDLGKNAYGPRLYKLTYPNEADRDRYEEGVFENRIPLNDDGTVKEIGFGISIHGNNYPSSIGKLASAGCILMRNRDIIRLDRFVKENLAVIIAKD